MTQKIFDIENEKDMADLWDIVPENVYKLIKDEYQVSYCDKNGTDIFTVPYRLIKINFHDKTEITRPIQEATEADIGKICAFWNIEKLYIGELRYIEKTDTGKYYKMSVPIAENLDFLHCRRLTKQEIEELC